MINLLYSLPDVLMAEIFEFDDTYRIFGNSNFQKDLHNGWLKMQTNHVKKRVDYLISDYIWNFPVCMFKNEYCFVAGCSVENGFEEFKQYNRVHIDRVDNFMVYVAPPKDNVLYYKVLPKEFIYKPQVFFENLKFDGFFCHPNYKVYSFWNDIDKKIYRNCMPSERHFWITTFEGQRRAPFMYRNTCLWR